MNRLANTRCYLAGAIEKAKDDGITWRQQIKHDLADLKILWLDPTDKPTSCAKETREYHKYLEHLRDIGDAKSLQEEMYPICRIDLRMVDISDFIIVNINPSIPTFGTHEEIGRAILQNKPILVHIDGKGEKVPLWWYERLDPSLFFYDWQEIYQHLRWINKYATGAHWHNYKWIFFDWMGEK